jgi:hypothetical protein
LITAATTTADTVRRVPVDLQQQRVEPGVVEQLMAQGVLLFLSG